MGKVAGALGWWEGIEQAVQQLPQPLHRSFAGAANESLQLGDTSSIGFRSGL